MPVWPDARIADLWDYGAAFHESWVQEIYGAGDLTKWPVRGKPSQPRLA